MGSELDMLGSNSGGLMPFGQDGRAFRRSPAGRAVARVQNNGIVRAAQVDVEATLAGQKIDAAGSIGRTVQNDVALLCQAEAALVQACGNELAARRIDLVTTQALLGLADLTSREISHLGRL